MRKRLKLLVTVCYDGITAPFAVPERPWGDARDVLQKSVTLPWTRFTPRVPAPNAG